MSPSVKRRKSSLSGAGKAGQGNLAKKGDSHATHDAKARHSPTEKGARRSFDGINSTEDDRGDEGFEAIVGVYKGLERKHEVEGEVGFALTRSLCLILIGILAFAVRLFAVLKFESVIHEFDPYFNYRTTRFLTQEGFNSFWNWFDDASWYPLGRVVGQTLFPALMVTGAWAHRLVNLAGFPIDVRDVCVFIAPVFAAFTSWSVYGLCREASGRRTASLIAALFIAVIPSYISRSTAGAFDNEAIAIFALCFSFYTYLRALRKGSILSVLLANAAYFYMVAAWGGYVFITNLIAIYTTMLVALNAFDDKGFRVYILWYLLGTLWCLNIPFVHLAAIKSSEHMASHGVALLALGWKLRQSLISYLSKRHSAGVSAGADASADAMAAKIVNLALKYSIVALFLAFQGLFAFLQYTGRIRFSGRSMTLLDPTYASKHVPIIASVSEHQATVWANFHFDLGPTFVLAPLGLYLSLTSERPAVWFLGIFAVLAAHFAGVMVRLMLILAPAAACLAGLAVDALWDYSYTHIYQGSVRLSSKSASASASASPSASASASASKKYPTKQDPFKKGGIGEVGPPIPRLGLSRCLGLSRFVGVVGLLTTLYLTYRMVVYGVWSSATIYSSPSIVTAASLNDGSRLIMDDFREAYSWLRANTHPAARVASWWDYGYQASFMANRTVLVDNNTWNTTHIAIVGLALGSPEEVAYPILQHLDVDYIFVVFGGLSRMSGDDINKFIWMVRIAEQFPFAHKEAEFMQDGRYDMGAGRVSEVMRNSLMFRLSYNGFADNEISGGVDALRHANIERTKPLKYFQEVYTTSAWSVRIYQLKKPNARLPFSSTPLQNYLTHPPALDSPS